MVEKRLARKERNSIARIQALLAGEAPASEEPSLQDVVRVLQMVSERKGEAREAAEAVSPGTDAAAALLAEMLAEMAREKWEEEQMEEEREEGMMMEEEEMMG